MKAKKETKKDKPIKINNIETTLNHLQKREDRNGFPDPISVQCFQCQNYFWVKWVVPQRNYSKKNNWGYWTGKEGDKDKFIDSLCLKKYYFEQREEFLRTVVPKKQTSFRSYLACNII